MTGSVLAKGSTLVVASHNEGKVREIRELLVPFGVETRSAAELGLDEPEETGLTFASNAQLKAKAAMQASGHVALADDSGLAVDALGGQPGIYSARWAGEPRDFGAAMAKVNDELAAAGAKTPKERRARFVCSLCLAFPGGQLITFDGTVEGEIVWPPRGTQGFGYDPVFVASGETLTFAEMEPARKHAMSHRANAFRKLVSHLSDLIEIG
jgi:XTP/dITP diphosphohydrolase